jgi:phosphoribosylformylglycinamidine synthase
MVEFNVTVIIENKPGISDPEGETILNDLILKSKNSSVKKIRAGKILRFLVTGNDKKSVERKVSKICDDLRIFNPLVSKVTISATRT